MSAHFSYAHAKNRLGHLYAYIITRIFISYVVQIHLDFCNICRLANKQDLTEAIDELDVVESLDIEHAANTMRCPTRVEMCSCIYNKEQSKSSTAGIKDGYK